MLPSIPVVLAKLLPSRMLCVLLSWYRSYLVLSPEVRNNTGYLFCLYRTTVQMSAMNKAAGHFI